jgi:hypothetical protein
MQHPIFRRVKRSCFILFIGAAALFQPACGTLTTSQRSALLVGAETLANIAGTAAATYYGGPVAGQLASAGLSALGSVLQGYVGTTIPASVVEATPGVANVGAAVAALVAPDHTVTQADVNTVNQAARIAATLNISAPVTTGAADTSVP